MVELFNEMSNEILNQSNKEYHQLISDGLNTHTGNKSDIVSFNDILCKELDIDEEQEE